MNINYYNCEMIAKISGYTIKPSKIREPKIGDKVILTDNAYDGIPGKEVARLARLPYCTIKDWLPIAIGSDGDYEYMYEIYVDETEYLIGFDWVYLKK